MDVFKKNNISLPVSKSLEQLWPCGPDECYGASLPPPCPTCWDWPPGDKCHLSLPCALGVLFPFLPLQLGSGGLVLLPHAGVSPGAIPTCVAI